MFIYSVRASTVKFFGFVLLTLAVLVGVVVFGANDNALASVNAEEIDYSGKKTKDDRIAFIESFGVKVDADSEEESSFAMPDNFDRVILGYNELQKKQGLDLSKYAKKRVTRYAYKVTNFNSEEEVYVNLFVYRSKIIACDISSVSPNGFVIPLTLVEKEKLK